MSILLSKLPKYGFFTLVIFLLLSGCAQKWSTDFFPADSIPLEISDGDSSVAMAQNENNSDRGQWNESDGGDGEPVIGGSDTPLYSCEPTSIHASIRNILLVRKFTGILSARLVVRKSIVRLSPLTRIVIPRGEQYSSLDGAFHLNIQHPKDGSKSYAGTVVYNGLTESVLCEDAPIVP